MHKYTLQELADNKHYVQSFTRKAALTHFEMVSLSHGIDEAKRNYCKNSVRPRQWWCDCPVVEGTKLLFKKPEWYDRLEGKEPPCIFWNKGTRTVRGFLKMREEGAYTSTALTTFENARLMTLAELDEWHSDFVRLLEEH